MTKNGLNEKGIAHAKYSVTFGPKKKLPKTCEKRFYKHIKVVLCKKRLFKTPNIWKIEHFQNNQKWPQCKGYSPCKILKFGPKIILPKTCEKRFYKDTKVVLWLLKRANIQEMVAF